MKYSIENKGTGIVMIRVFVPESMAASFLEFINRKDSEFVKSDPRLIRSVSRNNNENYYMEKTAAVLRAFDSLQHAEMSRPSVISEVLKKIKVLGFANVSYEQIRIILTENKCFQRPKSTK